MKNRNEKINELEAKAEAKEEEEVEIDYLQDKQLLFALERTKLSNERTLLAWIRTSIAFIGGGVAIIRLINFNTETHKVIAQVSGDTLIVIGILFLIFALVNYRKLADQISMPGYKERGSTFLTIVAGVLIILSIVLILII